MNDIRKNDAGLKVHFERKRRGKRKPHLSSNKNPFYLLPCIFPAGRPTQAEIGMKKKEKHLCVAPGEKQYEAGLGVGWGTEEFVVYAVCRGVEGSISL